jgi:hypothetical protein
MKTNSFKVGQEIRLKSDYKNRYRYVGRNIVQNIATGRVKSVKLENMKARTKVDYALDYIIPALWGTALGSVFYYMLKIFFHD